MYVVYCIFEFRIDSGHLHRFHQNGLIPGESALMVHSPNYCSHVFMQKSLDLTNVLTGNVGSKNM